MTYLHKLNNASILKWVSSNIAQNHLRPSRTPLQPIGYFLSSYTIELYNTKTSFKAEKPEMLDITSTSTGRNGGGTSRVILKEAQAALLEYLHCTRGFQFMDAENMSKNSPQFLNKLLRSIDGKIDKDIGGLISRYLRYHPINEFEPFFESLGLKPSEYIPHLPCNLMFLADDGLLLHNYTVLSSYGVARSKIGKIFKEAREVFRYDFEVLLSKLQAYEELGLSQFALVKFIVCSPYILVGDVNVPFVKLLEKLKCLGFKTHWIERNLSEDNSYSWSRILEVLRLFDEMGCSNKQLVELLGQHPDILFESSGERTLSLIGFLLKFGSTRSQICSMFLQFPQIQIVQFVLNLRKCVLVLNEIEMEVAEIQKIVCSHPLLLGLCALKSTNSLLSYLKIGKKRLSRYIQENPEALKKWVLGRRVEPLPDSEEDSKGKRVKFLLDVGFVANSNKMEVALKLFRGKGGELQDRFNCLVNAGLNRQDVCDMIKVSPQILNQQRDVLQMKIDVLVNHLGYPVSSLVNFPSYLSYTTQRVKLRVFMYNWLRGQGTISPTLALSTVVAMAEKQFLSQYVNHHPCGPQVWIASIPNWVSSIFHEYHLTSPRTLFHPIGVFPNVQIPRLYSTKMAPEIENHEILVETSTAKGRKGTHSHRYIQKEMQAALLEYLHSTRGLQFIDAENISKNCPHFIDKLFKRVDCEREIRKSMARFLRYHPINEFEPFFESLGLEPSEYVSLLPCNLMYLIDDELLLHNYTVLSYYGIPPNKVGKIYREAREVFRYDFQVLASKLQAYEELGLSRSALVHYVVGSPELLLGDVNAAFVSVFKKLKSIGFESNGMEGNLKEDNTYYWSRMLEVFSLFSEMGCSDEQSGKLLRHNPDILFESSGETTVSLIGLLQKFGFTKRELCSMFLQFPQIPVAKFVANLRQCILFLDEIDMKAAEIGKIVHSHTLLLGLCSLKKTKSLLDTLNVGKKRLSRYIQENPEELKNWVWGRRVESFPNSGDEVRSKAQRTKFLLDIGFVENSNKMKAALKACRGNGVELQERFDCIVKAGLDRKDVCEMVRSSPQILNQTTDVIEMKINCLVNELGYPIWSLLTAKRLLSYKMERVKLRVRMFNWLKDHGIADPGLSLSTLISCSESYFIKTYVHRHPAGPQVWHDLKNEIESDW
ncbi:PREDICTED: uncharacterized protein LOC101302386 [Fragaria vesca subsp. vesca]